MQKNSNLTNCSGDEEVQTFLKGISPKVNVLALLKGKLSLYDTANQHVNQYATWTPPNVYGFKRVTVVHKQERMS